MAVKVNNQWAYSEPSAKVGGEWKRFIRVWNKIDGVWVISSDNYTWSLFALEWEDDFFWEGITR